MKEGSSNRLIGRVGGKEGVIGSQARGSGIQEDVD